MIATRAGRLSPSSTRAGRKRRTVHATVIIALDDLLMLLGTEMGHVSHALSRGLGRPRLAIAS